MKKYLTIILATLFTMSVFTGCAGRNSSPEQSNVSITNSPIAASEPGKCRTIPLVKRNTKIVGFAIRRL